MADPDLTFFCIPCCVVVEDPMRVNAESSAAPVRAPSIEEEVAKRLLRCGERSAKERITSTVGGLPWFHGISGDKTGNPVFRERVDEFVTRYDTPLPLGILAEILGLVDRPDVVASKLRKVEVDKAAVRETPRATLDSHAATDGKEPDPVGVDDDVASNGVPVSTTSAHDGHYVAVLVRLYGNVRRYPLLGTGFTWPCVWRTTNIREISPLIGLVFDLHRQNWKCFG